MEVFWNQVTAWLQSPYVVSIGIFLVSFLIAKIADVIVSRLIVQLAKRTKTDFDDRLVDIMHHPIFWSVVLFGAYLALNTLALTEALAVVGIGLVKTLAILLWIGAGFKITKLFLISMSRAQHKLRWLDNQTLPLFDNLAKILVLAIGSYFFLLTWDIDVSAWLASAGIITITLGFAAKDTVANLFSGIFIMADAPYKIGDFILLDSGERGRVTQIGLRSTRILTRDDVEITIPNAIIANTKITNETGGPWEKERIRTTIGVEYGSDLEQVRTALREAVMAADHIDKHQEPRIRFRQFGDSSLIFQVMCWIDEPVLRGRALDSLNEQIYEKLNAAGINIPFPQRDVHLKSDA